MTARHLRHVAIIMDGNNRWAKQRGLPGIAGHKEGVERIREVMEACQASGVEVLTLFAFSSENWQRPAREVKALMALFLLYLKKEARDLKKRQVRLRVVGDRSRFSKALQLAIEKAEAITDVESAKTTLIIAADYGGRWEITQAAADIAQRVASGELSLGSINEACFNQHMPLSDLPELDLLIRTGGEQRISNFLLWQSAYAELYFCPTLWPDFNESALKAAVKNFYQRERRFGLTSEQLELQKVEPQQSVSQGGENA